MRVLCSLPVGLKLETPISKDIKSIDVLMQACCNLMESGSVAQFKLDILIKDFIVKNRYFISGAIYRYNSDDIIPLDLRRT